ncbi:hypothetical protein FK531_02355 [Rhodococcus spelaei]|uniref:Serine/threonine protein kinase n=1 Tax=Rhodococcus spelaei TaxID=2546320 RepID=A0A541BRI1_9NOCA|nr:hypothetical protein [Rhodococcus spelaei]TQF74925.1 hypothetical protein FK531_02355 [Rhodococcus spelaei]
MRADTERLPPVAASSPGLVRLPAGLSLAGHMPGSTFASQRYRLLVCCGTAPSVEFWHAVDLVSGREVGLTIVGAAGHGSVVDRVDTDDVFARTVWMCGVRSPAMTRILDMVDTDSGGAVVSEWLPSRSLGEVASTRPSRAAASQSIRPLVNTMRRAHEMDSILDLENPGRLRIGERGDVYLAFPGTLPGADRAADVRGLGAALRGLVTGGVGLTPVSATASAW